MSADPIYILSTGDIPGFAGLIIKSETIFFDIIPFNQTKLIRNEQIAGRIHRLSVRQAVVVFTSAKAVMAVHALLDNEQPTWKIYCIGYATQKKVLECFKKAEIVDTASNASDLAETIIGDGIGALTFFCGDLRRDELPNKLTGKDIAVEEIVVYKTAYSAMRVDKQYAGILFFSPGAVDSFFALNKPSGDTVLFAIGNTTASAIEKYSNFEIIISDQPDKLTLVSKAISYFQEKTNR